MLHKSSAWTSRGSKIAMVLMDVCTFAWCTNRKTTGFTLLKDCHKPWWLREIRIIKEEDRLKVGLRLKCSALTLAHAVTDRVCPCSNSGWKSFLVEVGNLIIFHELWRVGLAERDPDPVTERSRWLMDKSDYFPTLPTRRLSARLGLASSFRRSGVKRERSGHRVVYVSRALSNFMHINKVTSKLTVLSCTFLERSVEYKCWSNFMWHYVVMYVLNQSKYNAFLLYDVSKKIIHKYFICQH